MSMDDATLAQVRAARPNVSTWVSANAGSGKTRVLTDRVARLLEGGTDPARILCLTFTKAAAGEMQNRLFSRLGEWSMLSDEALRTALCNLEETPREVSETDLASARRLFARALEVPGGLKIQTIHAFCESLLRRFPLEAGVSPGFEVADERTVAQMMRDIVEDMASDPKSGFQAFVGHILSRESELQKLLRDILGQRDRLSAKGGDDDLRRALGLDRPAPPMPADSLGAEIIATLASVLDSVDVGGGRFRSGVAALSGRDRLSVLAVEKGFLKDDGTLMAAYEGNANFRKACPDGPQWLAAIAEATFEYRAYRLAREEYEAAVALRLFGQNFITRYDALKRQQALLDFDDQVRLARQLLTLRDAQDWVRYKLDGGIDHLLVDEAQDTSPEQWGVVDALTEEFFAGSGARDETRTLFVVGDEKQSIYSFQGADPARFGEQRNVYDGRLSAIGQSLQQSALEFSFRSAAPILQLVDTVFRRREPAEAGGDITHHAFHAEMPGRVDLWDFIGEQDEKEDAPWYEPIDLPPPGDPRQQLADRLADFLQRKLSEGAPMPGEDGVARPLRPQDILILVRGRSVLFRAILTALKERKLPVAGADRLKVMEHIAVRDLCSLLQAVATPRDDLSLAEALRSPLLDISEKDLFWLAQGRSGALVDAFETIDPETAPAAVARALEIYADLRGRADFLRPYELLDRILTRHGGRARIRAQLGAEAEEAVAALCDLALEYERTRTPTLTGFLDWLTSAEPERKRQLDPEGGEIRVMTIHNAKGLEAPMVILPDTIAASNKGQQGSTVLPVGADHLLLRGAKKTRSAVAEAAVSDEQARGAQEEWRLLYVALTRAARWLVVAGAGKADPKEDVDWYAAVAGAMRDLPCAPGEETGLTLSSDWPDTVDQTKDGTGPDDTPPLPHWLLAEAAAPPRPETPLAPSRSEEDLPPDPDAPDTWTNVQGTDAETARVRGILIHRLLEICPDVPPDERTASARALALATLAELSVELDPPVLQAALAEALAVLAAPGHAWLFAPGSVGEAPLRGRVAALGGRAVRGQIDRLVRRDGVLWAVDYKSDAIPPDDPAAIPPRYLRQLALYAAALQQGEESPVRAGILWTAAPGGGAFMALPHDAVTAALQLWSDH